MTIRNRQAAALPLTTALTLHAKVQGPGNWREPETRTLAEWIAEARERIAANDHCTNPDDVLECLDYLTCDYQDYHWESSADA